MAVTRLAKRLKNRPLLRISLAVAALGAAALLRFALTPVIGPAYPFITYFPAVMLTTFAAGVPHGIFVAVAAGFLAVRSGLPAESGRSLALVSGAYAAMMALTVTFMAFVRSIVEKLEMERARNAQLAELRETLFRELQHRVSNNFQIMASLIRLQQGQVSDKASLGVLGETAARLQLLSKLHRQLHDPGNQHVSAGRFLRGIIDDVLVSVGASNVTWSVQDDGTRLAFEQISPVALIITEIISNSVEHGFAERGGGKITIRVESRGGVATIKVRDNGSGLPANFDLASTKSLGMKIVRSLTEQIGGEILLRNDNGAIATLSFPLSAPSERETEQKKVSVKEPGMIPSGL